MIQREDKKIPFSSHFSWKLIKKKTSILLGFLVLILELSCDSLKNSHNRTILMLLLEENSDILLENSQQK